MGHRFESCSGYKKILKNIWKIKKLFVYLQRIFKIWSLTYLRLKNGEAAQMVDGRQTVIMEKNHLKKSLLGNNGSIEISYISPSTIWYLRNAGGSNPSLPTINNFIQFLVFFGSTYYLYIK